MKKLLQFLFILILGGFSCACVNTFAVHELNEIAHKFIENGNYEDAIPRYLASVDLDGSIYESRYNLANALHIVGKCKEAIEHAQEATKIKPDEPIAFYTLGVISSCAADNLLNEVKNDKITKLKPSDLLKNKKMQEEYAELLNMSNQAFEEYLKLVPNASDSADVSNIIKNNAELITDATVPKIEKPKKSYDYYRY